MYIGICFARQIRLYFDVKYDKMKKDLNDVNKLFHKYPADSFTRGKYFKLKKALKSVSKKPKRILETIRKSKHKGL